jgi:hypothetical protein
VIRPRRGNGDDKDHDHDERDSERPEVEPGHVMAPTSSARAASSRPMDGYFTDAARTNVRLPRSRLCELWPTRQARLPRGDRPISRLAGSESPGRGHDSGQSRVRDTAPGGAAGRSPGRPANARPAARHQDDPCPPQRESATPSGRVATASRATRARRWHVVASMTNAVARAARRGVRPPGAGLSRGPRDRAPSRSARSRPRR